MLVGDSSDKVIGDRFLLERLVGIGTVARVFLCKDLETGREAAVKLLHGSACAHEALLRRFKAETELLMRLDHPHLIKVFASGEHEGAPWHACMYARKGSLADVVLREGSIPVLPMLRYARQVVSALAYIHQLGIVHRDVKPENILLDDEQTAILGDFGIAMVPSHRLTKHDASLGTPAFMAPEQHKTPTQVGPQADLYALGASVFVSLTKQSGMLLLMAHTRDEALAKLSEQTSPHVGAFIDRATAFRPEDRYPDAEAMGEELDDLIRRLDAEGLR